MNLEDVSTQLLYSVVPIFSQEDNGGKYIGTGFVFSVDQKDGSSIPLLITNYHVVEKANMCFAEMHTSIDGKPSKEIANIRFDKNVLGGSKLGNLDLIALPFASALNELLKNNITVFYKGIGVNIIPKKDEVENLAAAENITFIGYPSSAYDKENKLPIYRQGITATPVWNDYGGEQAFLIDGNIFPGSSGSPVFIYDRLTHPTKDGVAVGGRILFVGVLTEAMIDKDGREHVGLGKVINCNAFYREINNYLKRLTGKSIEEM